MKGRIREFLTNLAAMVCICTTLVTYFYIVHGFGH
jgi:hypothetical protein